MALLGAPAIAVVRAIKTLLGFQGRNQFREIDIRTLCQGNIVECHRLALPDHFARIGQICS